MLLCVKQFCENDDIANKVFKSIDCETHSFICEFLITIWNAYEDRFLNGFVPITVIGWGAVTYVKSYLLCNEAWRNLYYVLLMSKRKWVIIKCWKLPVQFFITFDAQKMSIHENYRNVPIIAQQQIKQWKYGRRGLILSYIESYPPT